MSRRRHLCPTCHRPFPPPLVVTGPLRQRMVNILANRPDGLTINNLVDLVYADDPNGGPLTAPRSLNVMAHKANKQLRAQGYQIKSMWMGRGAIYRLVPLSAVRIVP